MELHLSDYLRDTKRIPGNAYNSWRQKKILEIREHIKYLVKRQNDLVTETTGAFSKASETSKSSALNQHTSKWITEGWINDQYVEHDEDFSELFNSTSPSDEIIRDIRRLKT